MRRLAAALPILCLAAPMQAQEADWTEVTARRQADGVRALEVDVEYVAGEIRVGPAGTGLLYETRLRYDARQFQPQRKWSVAEGTGRLHIGFEGLGEDGDLNLDLDEDDHGFLDLGLSPDVATTLEMQVGAALSRLELGGIPLTRLTYHTGASDTEISFASENPERMEKLELVAGAAELEARGLGNARFDEMSFKGGVGDVRLDFTGDWSGNASATVHMGLGSLTLVVPPELGVRIRKRGFLAALEAPGLERVDGAWQTDNWDSASSQLSIDLKAVLGSIEVKSSR